MVSSPPIRLPAATAQEGETVAIHGRASPPCRNDRFKIPAEHRPRGGSPLSRRAHRGIPKPQMIGSARQRVGNLQCSWGVTGYVAQCPPPRKLAKLGGFAPALAILWSCTPVLVIVCSARGGGFVLSGQPHHPRLLEIKRTGSDLRIVQAMRSTVPARREMFDQMKIEDRRLAISDDRRLIALLGR
jgi:hypothetical protein